MLYSSYRNYPIWYDILGEQKESPFTTKDPADADAKKHWKTGDISVGRTSAWKFLWPRPRQDQGMDIVLAIVSPWVASLHRHMLSLHPSNLT